MLTWIFPLTHRQSFLSCSTQTRLQAKYHHCAIEKAEHNITGLCKSCGSRSAGSLAVTAFQRTALPSTPLGALFLFPQSHWAGGNAIILPQSSVHPLYVTCPHPLFHSLQFVFANSTHATRTCNKAHLQQSKKISLRDPTKNHLYEITPPLPTTYFPDLLTKSVF